MINLTIDGKPISVQNGTTVLRAAQAHGVFIPTLCDHKDLQPYGGCRLCLVEVEGARTLQPACTMPAMPDMVVHTDTDKVRSMRKFVLNLLFSERNHFCPFCQVSGGDCELQNAAYREGMTHWQLQPNWQTYPVDASHPNFILDNNRCILCRRCVRACGELVGNFTLAVAERGIENLVVADNGVPLGESTCVACGACVQVCPTGAIIDRQSAYRGRETQVERTATVCVGCSVGCGIVALTRDNQLIRIEGDENAPLNQGVLCQVGRFAPLDEKRERLVTPLVKKDGALQAATWDEALRVIAERLQPLAGKTAEGVAALASTRLSAEALVVFKQIFADQFKSEMVTSLEEGQPTALSGALAETLGRAIEGKLEAVKSADCVVVIGANLADTHQVAGFFVKRNLPNGAILVVIDPNDNAFDALTAYTVKVTKGSDVDMLEGLQAAIVKTGLAKATAPAFNVEKILTALASKTGITEENALEIAGVIAKAQRPVIVYGKGITARATVQPLKALLELARLAGAQVVSVKGEANSLAAAQYKLDRQFETNGHKAVYVALGDEYPSQRLLQRLEQVPFIVAQASYASRLTAIADVVLPVAMWAEQAGHYVSLDGRVQKARAALTPPTEVRSNLAALQAVAERLGMLSDADWQSALRERVAPVTIEN